MTTIAAPRTGTHSRAFTGVEYDIPAASERDARFTELRGRAEAARRAGAQVVVVQGLGFVGAVMAAVTAQVTRADGAPRYFVIGVDLGTPESYWKIGMINDGEAPVVSEDARVVEYTRRAVLERRNLAATPDERAYGLADVVVVDVNLDVHGRRVGEDGKPPVVMDPFLAAIRSIGRHLQPSTLVLIETTVPPGTTENRVLPLLRSMLADRCITAEPLVAHSYERVMPGRNYVASIESFWRTFAATSAEAAVRARDFLSSIIDVDRFPLRQLDRPTASELAKVLENSYRAANIALIHEWTRAAEAIGVNLFEVVDSIAVRKGTHDNIRRPGFGVGGYCLTKDAFVAQWGITELCGADVELDLTMRAMNVNHGMPRHAFELVARALGDLRGRTVLVAGVSYLNDVGDTRNSPTQDFCDLLVEAGASPVVHDPYVRWWPERPEIPNVAFAEGVREAEAVVLAVRHAPLVALTVDDLAGPRVRCVLDTQNMVSDETAAALFARGIRPVGVGKGHWSTRFAGQA